MRVLWFAVSPSMYAPHATNGIGWIASLEHIVKTYSNIELGIAFEHTDKEFKVVVNGVTYYPMNVFTTKLLKFKRRWNKTEEMLFIPQCLKVIEDFKPDIIHIFGSEWCFGLVQEYTNVPVVIHIQGSIPSYNNASLPPGYGGKDFRKYLGWWKIKEQIYLKLASKFQYDRGIREERILEQCKYFMGRTDWDYSLTRLYSPKSKYYHCWEALRPSFLNSEEEWRIKPDDKCILLTTCGPSTLKGLDTILKTAKILKEHSQIDFEWRIAGCKEIDFFESHENIKCQNVNVRCLGNLGANDLIDQLLNCSIYVHPAYIDNSPNAICEAMYLGVPIIATYVGGIPSLIEDNKTGLFVASNDPFTLAFKINALFENHSLRSKLGASARNIALERHDPKNIIRHLLMIYDEISKGKKKNYVHI